MAKETVQSKLHYECDCATFSISIQQYHADNGIFTSKEFMHELLHKGQGIKVSGVSAQFQNGAVENAQKIVVQQAHTSMIHTALHWPTMAEQDLWPLALSHAVHMYSHMPDPATGYSPIELYSQTKSNHATLLNAHPWGCPVYVLDPKLPDGYKLPK